MTPGLKAFLFIAGFAFLLWRFAGERWFKLTLGTWWFLLSRPPVFVTSVVGTIGCGAMLYWSATAEGNDPTENLLLFGGLSVMCGVGVASLLVPPVFFLRRMRLEKPRLDLPEDEDVTLELRANHWLEGESRGGTLYLTERALHFVPSRFSIQMVKWSLQRDEIAKLEEAGARLLAIHDVSGHEHLIVLEHRSELADQLAA